MKIAQGITAGLSISIIPLDIAYHSIQSAFISVHQLFLLFSVLSVSPVVSFLPDLAPGITSRFDADQVPVS
jgi:hypothetical protein